MQFLTNINLNNNELQNAVVHKLATAPSNLSARIYFNTVTKRFMGYNGTKWLPLDLSTDEVQVSTEKNQPGGYVGLGEDGKISTDYLPATVLGAMQYKGALDASGEIYPTPEEQGDYWIISVQGTIAGTVYNVGDWAVYNGTGWDKVNNSESVIAAGSVLNSMLANMAQNTFKGRKTAGSGAPEDLTAAEVRTILNVEDGANAYTHPTTDGSKHVPANGTTNAGKVLTAGSEAGAYTWQLPVKKHTTYLDVGLFSGATATVTHNLGTQDLVAAVISDADNSIVYVDVDFPTVNTARVLFATQPSSNAYKLVLLG